MYELNSRA